MIPKVELSQVVILYEKKKPKSTSWKKKTFEIKIICLERLFRIDYMRCCRAFYPVLLSKVPLWLLSAGLAVVPPLT